MRLRSLLAGVAVLAMSASLCATSALQADTTDSGGPAISPALVAEIRAKSRVRSIIQLKPGHSVQAVASDVEKASEGSRVVESARSDRFFVAELDDSTLATLRKDVRVQAVYKDELLPAILDASTNVIRSTQANQAGWTGSGTTVAVLDTGIDRDHPFFAGRLVDEACFSSSDAAEGTVSLCPNNQASQLGAGAADAETAQCLVDGANACSHGSHVTGIAAGRRAAGAPSDGVAPAAGIMAIQVFNRVDDALRCTAAGTRAPCFLSYVSNQKLALEHVARVARTHNVAAVNMSLGGGGPFSEPCDADADAAALKPEFDALVAAGVAPVVAAGNHGFQNGVAMPACISSAIAVGATDDADALAPFTNRGPLLDFFAPGVNINASVPDDTYRQMSGTSMSAPHVAGAFALMRQAYPDFTVAQSLQRLRNTGTPIRFDAAGTPVSTPRIDVERATSEARAPADPRV
ncbi:S8 family serine peptidase [Nonomuraea sp. K274]|uniref:S8 family serine peptidase n=1 Tax=Nonomuraea cypriaca TaxID=1187855 RepID=A0A931F601_9ACTN|nr:S8 family serine peptidase [Nonomuraea cypriaca]MBF8192636.1 S8 family serine peptidase [Nonomuraea cypriaca]